MKPFELRTERLLLSTPTIDDVDAVAAYCQDLEIQKWTSVPSPYEREDAVKFIEQTVPGLWEKDAPSWLIRTQDGVVVGSIDFHHSCIPGSRTEIGYLLTPEARGHGYMLEAVNAVIDWAFDEADVAAIGWACQIDHEGMTNWASAKVAWQAGFTFEGVIRAKVPNKGELFDALVGTLTPSDPRAPQNAWRGPTTKRPAFADPRDPEALVRQFHEVYRLPIAEDGPSADRERIHMRMRLIAEEFAELSAAVYGDRAEEALLAAFAAAVSDDDHTRDTVETADALADLVYVTYGMALELGISLPDVLAEVQASNLSKLGADGQPIYREDGKVLKGPGFFEPNIAAVLATAKERALRAQEVSEGAESPASGIINE